MNYVSISLLGEPCLNAMCLFVLIVAVLPNYT